MRFYALLVGINVACFLPLYFLNMRASPNPFAFLKVARREGWTWPIKLMYLRFRSPDPFRVHFDYTFFVLVAVAVGETGPIARGVASLLLVVGFIEIVYTTVMHSIFRRPPSLASDLVLLKAGLSLARGQARWMVPAVVAVLGLLSVAAISATSAVFAFDPGDTRLVVAVALVLVPPCVYHAETTYPEYLSRTVYSPLLHIVLNVRFDAETRRVYARPTAHYESHNVFRDVRLEGAPDVVFVCVESYGSLVYRDPARASGLSSLFERWIPELAGKGYRFASTYSDPPLFAGGSWLSYASFAYGARIGSARLYEVLFSRPSSFNAYESVFHVLRRNGYENVLLCPLGGVDARTVQWDAVERCFQSDRRIAYEDLAYRGTRVNFLGVVRLHAPLDQYSLNFAYEDARRRGGPFSLFFCTLNSHYPWHSKLEAAEDWRALNESPGEVEASGSPDERYNAAIRYQLDYIFRFAADRAGDAPLIVLFGDHQPPFITPDEMGNQTPVHVLSTNAAVIDALVADGFAPSLDLRGSKPREVRHEGLLSLLLRALQGAYGSDPSLEVPYLEHGSQVFSAAAPPGR